MKKSISFAFLVFLVLLVRQLVTVDNDWGYVILNGEKSEYNYLSPARDRVVKIEFDVNKKPKELDDVALWLFYTWGLRTDSIYNSDPLENGWWFFRYKNFKKNSIIISRPIEDLYPEIIRRDFSDSKIATNAPKVYIINATGINGLGQRLAGLFEVNGFKIERVSSDDTGKDIVCELSGSRWILGFLKNIPLDKCRINYNNEDEVLLKVGEKSSMMVQYLLYGRSF